MSSTLETVTEISLDRLPLFRKGKVRNMYDLGEQLLMVASDRISAFDYVLPNGIPNKGKVLTELSAFWFKKTSNLIPNHFISNEWKDFPKELSPYRQILDHRTTLVKKAKLIEIECVVRGYLAGSAWKEYKQSGTVCSQKLPSGLIEASELAEPIFTPATKSFTGHDENISIQKMCDIVGKEIGRELERKSIAIYKFAHQLCKKKGILLADTKFEFGLLNGELIVIDELLTPDSSRYWIADQFKPGQTQPGFDKQYVRDFLETIHWNKQPPVPELPQHVIQKTSELYQEIFKILTA